MEYQRASAATAFTKKLSNGHSFNGKNMYDGVFGGQSKVGSSVEDYAEIFGGGSGSSIPFLDVPELNQRKFSVDVSSSKLDYSNIFGGFGDFDFPVSHEEFVPKPTRDKKRPAKPPSYSEGSFSYPSSNPAGNQVSENDGVKQFKMSYNKSSPGSKNGTNGTIHVAVPGYTYVVDEKITPPREKPVSSVPNKPCETNKFDEGKRDSIHCEKPASDVQPCGVGKQTSKDVGQLHSETKSNGPDCVGKQTSKDVGQLHSETKSNGPDCNDVLFGAYDFSHRTPTSKVTRASSMLDYKTVDKRDSLKFEVTRSQSLDCDVGVSSPPYFDDEVDANSVAATSAAAVKKAIEEAQARLKVAKEIMERRKGHMVRVKPNCNGSWRGEGREKGKDFVKQNNFREDKAQKSSEKVVASLQTFDGLKMQNVVKVHQVAAESEDRERGFIAREAGRDTCANNFVSSQVDCGQEVEKREATKEGKREKHVVQDMNKLEGEENKIIEKPERSEVFEEATAQERKLDASKEIFDREECLQKLMPDVEYHDPIEDETKLRFGEQWEETEEKLRNELETCEMKLKEPEKPNDERKVETQESKDTCYLERLRVAQEVVDMEGKPKPMIEVEENDYDSKNVSEKEENEMLLQEVSVQKEFNKISEDAFEISELKEGHKASCRAEESNEEEDACDREDNEQMSDKMEEEKINLRDNAFVHEEEMGKVEEIGDLLGNEEFMEAEENGDLPEYAYLMEPADEVQKEASESMETEEVQKQTGQQVDAYLMEAADEVQKEASESMETEEVQKQTGQEADAYLMEAADEVQKEASESMKTEEVQKQTGQEADAYLMEAADEVQKEASESMKTEEVQKQTRLEADEMTQAREDALDCNWEDLEVADDAYNGDEYDNLGQNSEPSSNADSCEMTPDLFLNEENGGIAEGCKAYSESSEARRDSEADEVASDLEENLAFDKSNVAESSLKPNEIKQQEENTTDAFNFDSNIDADTVDVTSEKDRYEQFSRNSENIFTVEKHVEELVCESEDVREGKFSFMQEVNKYNFEHSDEVRSADSQLHCEVGEKHGATLIAHEIEAGQSTEYEEHCPPTQRKVERETKNASQEEAKVVKEEQKRVDEAKERERERGREKEKERKAVERAIREARERAFAEARERAAAGQRKAKAETQGESAKPVAEANEKTFMEAKLKAERAAVERATAEARQRALEKALSEKISLGARNQAEKFSDTKQSFQSYDSRYKGSCPPATSRYPTSSSQSDSKYSEGLDGAAGESALRCKARLERHQRTSERAAKALAEKNERDLLVLKEQAERNRIAETLDAEVKRWSNGKKGNLRALLSTLQYVLGPDSGWQPIPLTDIIATAAVKKAYRKATLCVHPDKLQQRGATIQQKYICEKVFDLLKEAWNRFSAEER